MTAFEVPPERGGVLLYPFTPRAGTARALLYSSEYAVVSWEALCEEGVTIEEILARPAAAVLAWIRTRDGQCVSWKMLRERGLTAARLLDAWGPQLTPTIARALKLDPAALRALGLTVPEAEALGWTADRWAELFGTVPVFEAAPHRLRGARFENLRL